MHKVAPAIYSHTSNAWGYYPYEELVECVNNVRRSINKTPLRANDVWERFFGLNTFVRRDYPLSFNSLKVLKASNKTVCEEWVDGDVLPLLNVDEMLFVPVLWGKRVLEVVRGGAGCARRIEHHGRVRSVTYHGALPDKIGLFD
jgi:hypothetical protein